MLTRLTHAAIAFAVTAVLYQVYFVAVVPFVEPPQAAVQVAVATADRSFEAGAQALDKHRALLSAYFPPDHWSLARPPKTIGNGQMLIVIDQYKQFDNGTVQAPHCAIIFFRGGFDAAAPPRDAVVLESSEGAELEMKQSIDQIDSSFGDFYRGKLKGAVTVRSDMREPGTDDDLLIETRDLYINEDLIHTSESVSLRMGAHHGFGQNLEIRLMKTERPDGASGFYSSFEDLVIKHDVTASFTAKQSGLLGKPSDSASANGPEVAGPPIRIKSAGPFRIDFGSYKASFDDQVRAWQIQPDGQMDELLASKLTLFFTKTNEWNSADGGVTPTPNPLGGGAFSFEPASIEALGTPEAPVLLKAPSRQAMATGGKLWIELANRRLSRITLEEGEEVVLRHQGAEIHARTLRYQLPAEGSGQQIGAMSARGGSGWLRAVVDPARPNEVLEVSWKDAMQLVRRNGQPVLVLDGRPKVSLAGRTLWADQLQIFLREQAAQAAAATTAALPPSLTSSVSPERITATGRVGIESTEMTVKVNQLNIEIDQEAGDPAAATTTGTAGAAAAPPSPFALDGGASDRSYAITGVTLDMHVVVRGRRPDVRAIRVDGGVLFEESSPSGALDAPLRIVADKLQVSGADTPNARIDIFGGGGQNGAPLQDAEINAGGAEIRAPALSINRGASEAVINSPGKLKLLVDRDMTGNPLPAPAPMWIDWQESMRLEGRRITFLGDVYVRSDASGWLRTRRLVAQTTADIRFDGGGQQRPQLEQIECWEGAVADFEQRDISGVTGRHHVELKSLSANQITGAISGIGPGFIDSVHFAKNSANLLAFDNKAAQAAAPELMQAQPELRHLHIDFVRNVDGDLRSKNIRVHGDVQAVYGPVKTWEDRLVMSPEGDPGQGVVWITCETLGVTESPIAQVTAAKTRQFELMAEGHVSIEGQDPRQGLFTAYGHRAQFDQAKGLFILEGDGVTPATIEQQQFPGAPSSPKSAQRISFNQNTGTVRIDQWQGGRFDQFDLGRQPSAPAPR